MTCFDVTYIELTAGSQKSVLTLSFCLFCRMILLGVILQYSFWKPTATINHNFHLQLSAHEGDLTSLLLNPFLRLLQIVYLLSARCKNPVVISALFHYPFCSKAAVAWLMNDDSERSNKNTWCKWAVSSVIPWCLVIVTSWHFPLKVSSCNFISLWLYISGIWCIKGIFQIKLIFHHFVGSGSGEIF